MITQWFPRERRLPSQWRPYCRWIAGICFAMLAVSSILPARADAESLEYRVKAAMVYNFAKFVLWPGEKPIRQSLMVGVLGDDSFDESLARALAGRSVYGHPVRVRHLEPGEKIGDCHVLIVGRSERRRIPQLLEQVRGLAVLTISDIDEFAAAGGMIGFVMADGRIRFEVNLDAARREGLQISSKLVRLAVAQRQTEARKE